MSKEVWVDPWGDDIAYLESTLKAEGYTYTIYSDECKYTMHDFIVFTFETEDIANKVRDFVEECC
ncbi:hypothetical protein NVP1084O_195 [Vibrio phage 1.084.O._10N.261.49.F5]|nr:hypothetical protein NVP1084O_195 [Vibrio phage 1.084.O._10N.261.49.F5]